MLFYCKEMEELNETIFGIVRSVGSGLMLVGDLKCKMLAIPSAKANG